MFSPLSSSIVISLSNSGVRYPCLGLVSPPDFVENELTIKRVLRSQDLHRAVSLASPRHGSTIAGSAAADCASIRSIRLPPVSRPADFTDFHHRSSATRRPLGLGPSRCPEEEDFAHEEAPSANGRKGLEGCEEPQQMSRLRSSQAGPYVVPPLCERYVCVLAAPGGMRSPTNISGELSEIRSLGCGVPW